MARKNQEQWIVEVKGDYDRSTAQYNVNFDTGIGQLVKSISVVNENINYAICIPLSRTEQGRQYILQACSSQIFRICGI